MELNRGRVAQIAAGRPSPLAAGTASAILAHVAPWLGQAGLPFLLVTYLGLKSGGYDAIVRSEVGIAVWWIVLLGAAVGALPLARFGRAAWIALGLLVAFCAWTALGAAWSESAERSVAELARVAALLGVFALALAVQGREGLRRMVGGVAAGIALVGGVALMSRFQPSWFPELETPDFVPGTQSRLHYPLNYWNGLAAFVAIGLPLLLALATTARHLAARALAVAAVPALALTAFYTLSRGGAVEIAIALVVLFALHPRRLELLVPTALAGLGGGILIAGASQRDALGDGLTTATATSQGDEMLAMTLVVCAGVGLIATAVGLAQRRGLILSVQVSRRAAARTGALIAGLAVAITLAAIASGAVSDTWNEFKNPEVPDAGAERFDSASGSGRYQFWQAAVDAGETEPLVGIGPGTYEYFWAREGSLPAFIRDAHSLYLETFAELGIVGLALVLGVVAIPFVGGARGLFRLDPEQRALAAGALAACAAFAAAAAIDWAWELTVLPVMFLLLTSALIARPRSEDAEPAAPRATLAARVALPALAVAGIVAIGIPTTSANALRDSQADVRAEDLGAALGEARTAEDIEPYAAAPNLQQALVLELQGDLDGALAAAREATDQEPTNWRTWLVLSRLEAQADNPAGAIEAYREARSLNPRSELFQ
jgi:O-Antigen ligase